MIFGAGEFLVQQCRKRGILMYVDTDGRVMYRPANLMPPELLRLVEKRFSQIKEYLIAEAVSGGDDDERRRSA